MDILPDIPKKLTFLDLKITWVLLHLARFLPLLSREAQKELTNLNNYYLSLISQDLNFSDLKMILNDNEASVNISSKCICLSFYLYINFLAPLQGNYSEALPAQARPKRRDVDLIKQNRAKSASISGYSLIFWYKKCLLRMDLSSRS